MTRRGEIRFVLTVAGLFLAGLLIIVALPERFTASPISEEPRSMMGSGFVNDWPDVGPRTYFWSRYLPLRVDDPENTNIVIWNHHTEAQQGAPSCLGSHYFPPPSIMALERIGKTRVYYLCTRSTQEAEKPFYAIQRREEILTLAARFRDLGVPAHRIFLSGQSGGSCSSLLALAEEPDAVNAGILFAPACYGPEEGLKRNVGMAPELQQAIESMMTDAEEITALLVAFTKDRWNKPSQLSFLTESHPDSIELFSPGCGADHGGAFHGCGLEDVEKAVREYFLKRLDQATAEEATSG